MMTGTDLRKVRTETLRMTQAELAEALGLSPLRICQLEGLRKKYIHIRTEMALNWLVLRHKRNQARKRAFKRTIRERRVAA